MSITAIRISIAPFGIIVDLCDAFSDIERAIDIFEELAEVKEDLDFKTVDVAIKHVEDEYPDAVVTEQMKWLAHNIKQGEDDTLDMVVSLLEDMQETVESFEGDESAFDAYCALYGAHYLSPGEVVSFNKYTRREMIEREINNISESDRVLNIDKIRHLLDDDAVLAQAEQGEGVIEMGGSYYVFDN